MPGNDSITAATTAGSQSPPPVTTGRLKRERPAAVDASSSHLSSSSSVVVALDTAGETRASTPGSASGPEVKKRKTVPGSRGVANLTPEQLAKKRANDREAQRAIRERTKLTIENLERRIRELTSQQPYQELQAALRAKEAVEAENADIKRRLASIVAMMQPLIGATHPPVDNGGGGPILPSPSHSSFMHMVGPVNTTGPHQSVAACAPNSVATPSSNATSPPASADPYCSQWNSNASTGSGPVATTSTTAATATTAGGLSYRAQLDQQRHELAHGLELGSERLGLDFLLDQARGPGPSRSDGHVYATASAAAAAAAAAADTTASYRHHQQHQHHCSSPGRDANIDPALQNNIDPALAISSPPAPLPPPPHAIPIKNSAPTCPLDSLLLDFLHERRQRAAEGFPPHDIIGPRYPSISSLLNPLRETHPLSKVFIDILHTFPNISRLPERVAVLYVMFLLMRWQIDSSSAASPAARDHWDRLPAFLRPLPVQQAVAHPPWIDHLPFPAMRERLIRDWAPPHEFPFENFFVPFTSTLSVNWPYEDTDTLLQGPGEGGDQELMINPVFERHLRRAENWTLGPAFAKALPMLDGTYTLEMESRNGEGGGGGGGGRASVGSASVNGGGSDIAGAQRT